MKLVTAPISVGELVDKHSILAIKARRIADKNKLVDINRELSALEAICREAAVNTEGGLYQRLLEVNEKLWDIEDEIRQCERDKDFGPRFVSLARAVYVTNDQRYAIKSEVNVEYGSVHREVKSYEHY